MTATTFNTLPADVKLHIFSFLNTRDVLSVLQVDRMNHNLYLDSRVWAQRLSRDFQIDKHSNAPGENYVNYRRQYPELQKRIICNYVRAYANISNVKVVETILEYNRRVENLFSILEVGNLMEAQELSLQLAEFTTSHCAYDCGGEVDRVYEKLCLSPAEQSHQFMSEVFILSDEAMVAQCNNVNFARRIVAAMVAFKADLSISHFMRRVLSHADTAKILEVVGSELLLYAIRSANMVLFSQVVNSGINVNISHAVQEDTYTRHVPIIYDAIMVALYVGLQRNEIDVTPTSSNENLNASDGPDVSLCIEELKIIKSMIATLLKAGADPEQNCMVSGSGLARFGSLWHEPQNAMELAQHCNDTIGTALSDTPVVIVNEIQAILRMVLSAKTELQDDVDRKNKCVIA